MSPQSAIRVRVAAAGQDGAAVPAAEVLRDRPADHEKEVREAPGAVEGVGRKKDLGANITKLFDGATGKKPGRIVESVVRLCE
jgi:hypothetical protein